MIAPRIVSSKLCESEGVNMEVLGMLQKNKDVLFKTRENNKTVIMNRDEIMSKSPASLVVFYEKHMKMVPGHAN